MWDLVGIHHPFPPEPIIAENTRYVDAGCVKIGLETRCLDGLAGRLQATLEGTPFEEVYREWAAAHIPQPDGGLKPPPPNSRNTALAASAAAGSGMDASLHVVDCESGHEYLRFDCFEDVPHYHYLHPWTKPEEYDNHWVPWDQVAHGPMMPWALDCLRSRLPEMLNEAGGGELTAHLDHALVNRAVNQIEELVREVLALPE